MHVIRTTNVNQALAEALYFLKDFGIRETSRNGDVIVSPDPVVTEYQFSQQRVLFAPTRDPNPFFHFMEALWMLNGGNDVKFPAYFNKNFGSYSDNGEVFHGAYGHRWRKWFGYDQLSIIANELRKNRDTRRAVLAMWDANSDGFEVDTYGSVWPTSGDLYKATIGSGKDVPCNTHVYFDGRGERLNMTVCCRSNDVIWGAYGSNVVHFSMLQELLAAWTQLEVGVYRQLSNNFHIYEATYPESKWLQTANESSQFDLYVRRPHTGMIFPMVNILHVKDWLEDLAEFVIHPLEPKFKYGDKFFTDVAVPMYRAWYERKENKHQSTIYAEAIIAEDWKAGCMQWIQRHNEMKVKEAKA